MRVKVLLAVVCLALLAGQAAAQVPTGTISGRVLDQGGDPVPGVTVTATSPNLQGTRSAVTSSTGDYALPLLPPGTYALTFELTGFEQVNRTIPVAPTQTVPVDVRLSLAGVTEAITVTAPAGAFVETAQVATSIQQSLMNTLPTSRSLVASVLMAPNVRASGPGGTTGGDGALQISGAMSFDSLYMINGVAVTENLRGQPYTLFIEDAIQETTVSTAGISAEYGRFGGGLVNAITKSGGNRFSGSFRNWFNNDSWRTTTPFDEAKLDKTIPTYEYTFGGPVLRDRLWFFTAGRMRTQEEARQTAVTLVDYIRTDEEQRYEGKVTYSPLPNHSVRGSFMKVNQQVTNVNFQNAMDLRSLYDQGQPQDLLSLNYNGIFGSSLTLEGQYSRRNFTFQGAGARSTDLIDGTLLIDRARGGTAFRYWSATFCGVCDPEERDNTEVVTKGTYFVSSDRAGTHAVTFGYNNFLDHRFTNNRQSGSDYRILGTSTVVRGGEIYPVFLGDDSTFIVWNPIAQSSNGTDLRTHSVFVNDSWRASNRLTLNLGLRFDRNAGEDAANNVVSNSQAFSPRLGFVFDPTGAGRWSFTGSFGRYVSSLSSAITEVSPAGNPADYSWFYRGPSINADANGALVTPDVAIRTLFDWFNANGGTSRPFRSADVPGVNSFVADDLKSPSSYEWAGGVARTFTRGSVRFDYVFRNFKDFYVTNTNLGTGQVTDELGADYDVNFIANDQGDLKRRYQGGTVSANYRIANGIEVGGNYTVSRLWGNVDGENPASGPLTATFFSYPEYRQASWNLPEGDLSADQRHRTRVWGVYRVPMSERAGILDIGVLFGAASGVPYGTATNPGTAAGQIDPVPYVTNPGYVAPLSSSQTGLIDYFFFARDRYRTEAQFRTDLSVNYGYRILGQLEAFFHADVLNVFNQFQLCGCGGTVFNNGGGSDIRNIGTGVLTSSNTPTLQPFNPFTETPVEGVHYRLNPNFGTAINRYAYTSPLTFRFNVGVRF